MHLLPVIADTLPLVTASVALPRSERRLADCMPYAWSCWLCPIGLNRDGLPLVPYRQA